MQITEVRIDRMKGQRVVWQPSRLNLLTGPNGSGKTARMLALQWAIHGCTPHGKKPEFIAPLSIDGAGMSVRMKLADGFGWYRSLDRDPVKFSLSQSIVIDGREAETLKGDHAQACIGERCGAFRAALDLSELTSLSPDARRQFVLRLSSQGGQPGEEMLERLELAMLGKILDDGHVWTYCKATYKCTPDDLNAKQRKATCEALWETVDKRLADAWNSMQIRFAAGLVEDAVATITAWIDLAKTLKSEHRAKRDDAEAATRKLAEEQNQITVVSEHISTLRASVEALQVKIGDADQLIGAHEGRSRAIAQAKARVQRAEVALTRARSNRTTLQRTADAHDWAAELAAAEAKLTAVGAVDFTAAAEAAKSANARVCELRTQAERAANEAREIGSAIDRAESELESGRRSLDRLRGDAWVTAKTMLDEAIDAAALCVNAREHFNTLVSHIAHQAASAVGDIDGLEFTIASLEQDIAADRAKHADATVGATSASFAVREAEAMHDTAQRAMTELNQKAQSASECRNEIERIGRERDDLDRRILEADEAVRRGEAEALDAAGNLTHEQERACGESLEALQAERQRLVDEQAGINAKIKAKERFDVLDGELTKCQQRAQAEMVAYTLSEHLEKAVKRLREGLLARLVAPLIGRINSWFGAAGMIGAAVPVGGDMRFVRCYCDLENEKGKSIFAMGWVVEDENGIEHKITFETLSGGEAALFGAALAYALVTLDRSPVKLLTIEADALGNENLGRLLQAFSTLGGEIDHVIVSTCKEIKSAPAEWTVEDLAVAMAEAA